MNRRTKKFLTLLFIFLFWNFLFFFYLTLKHPLIFKSDESYINHDSVSSENPEYEDKEVVTTLPPAPKTKSIYPPSLHRKLIHRTTPKIVVLVMACNRPSVKRNLDQLLQYRTSALKFPIVVSQDCGHVQTSDVIDSYGDQLVHIKQPDQSLFDLPNKQLHLRGYYRISRHYKWALNQVFRVYNYSAAIIIEDDLDISLDFFEYFKATYQLLASDRTLWCVSAWNDNGKTSLVDINSSEQLYRSDFFPGLGWMLKKDLWEELEPKWPITFWDDWMRHPDQRLDRACVRPEVSRTSTFGRVGVSKGQFYDKHLRFIEANKAFIPFTKLNLAYLLKENYDPAFLETVYQEATRLTVDDLFNIVDTWSMGRPKVVRVEYGNGAEFTSAAKRLGIMEDTKSGVPRTGYKGIVSVFYRGIRVYLAPYKKKNGTNMTLL